ncbi:MAG: PQQ-binding-like beta-propeller repeat protein [Acidobacteria bacterium]|nr:PQQ-binding-like beta-propeller repeat protein [Acidobacteriota bacterium]
MMRLFFLLATAIAMLPAAEDGKALFEKNCATCHKDPPVNRAPLLEALTRLSRDAIVLSMQTGTMREQGAALSIEQKMAVAEFIARSAKVEPLKGLCEPGYEARTDSSFWNGWGVDEANTRFQTAKMAGMTASQIPKLELKWAFGLPNSSAAISQPAVVSGRIYFGSQDGTVYSADARTGCAFWTFKAPVTVRTAMTIGTVGHARQAVMFGDQQANVYAVDTRDGKLLWKAKVDDHPVARITGAPKMHGSRLYVPVSSVEEVSSGSPKYECCKFRGSVAAVDVESGKVAWKTHTIPDPPRPTKKNSEGVQLHGPAGAAVWLSPTLDLKTRRVYVGTGNAYADPETRYSDAVIAMDMDSGSMQWVTQLTERDGWNFSCVNPNRANCPEALGPDVDIGASPILRVLPDGKRVLVVGQKSGIVHALDPDANGRILWQTRVGAGGALGGVQWGMAADEEHVYVALSDINKRDKAGGLFALELATGEKAWYAPPATPSCAGVRGCSQAQMAPVTAIPGVVFSGAMDGVIRAYDAKSGKVIWEFNTLRDFQTVNGVKARGGSLSATGPVLAAGMMYLNSGYGVLGGISGNVLLAFAPANQ